MSAATTSQAHQHEVVLLDSDEEDSQPGPSFRDPRVRSRIRKTARRAAPQARRQVPVVSLLPTSQTRSSRRQQPAHQGEVVDLTGHSDDEALGVAPLQTTQRRSVSAPAPPLSFASRQLPLAESPPKPGAKCAVCLESVSEPACGPCGHVFCKDCLTAAVKAHKKCPTCRKNMQLRQIHRIYLT